MAVLLLPRAARASSFSSFSFYTARSRSILGINARGAAVAALVEHELSLPWRGVHVSVSAADAEAPLPRELAQCVRVVVQERYDSDTFIYFFLNHPCVVYPQHAAAEFSRGVYILNLQENCWCFDLRVVVPISMVQ